MPAEIVTGQNFYDPTFTSGLGKAFNAGQDVATKVGGAALPGVANMLLPGSGTALSMARNFTPDMASSAGKLEGHDTKWEGGVDKFGDVAAKMTPMAMGMAGDMGAFNNLNPIQMENNPLQFLASNGGQYGKGGCMCGKGGCMKCGGHMKMFAGGPQMMMPYPDGEQTGPQVNKFNGPPHAEGGYDVAPGVEFEKDETSWGNEKYAFSPNGEVPGTQKTNKKGKPIKGTGITFADMSKKYDFKDTDDDITKNTKKYKLNKLRDQNEEYRMAELAKDQKKLAKEQEKFMAKYGGMYPDGGFHAQANPNEKSIMFGGNASTGNLSGQGNVMLSPHAQNYSGSLAYQVNPNLSLSGGASYSPEGGVNPNIGVNYQSGNFGANVNYDFKGYPTFGANYKFRKEDGGYYTPAEALANGAKLTQAVTQYGSNAGNYGGGSTQYSNGGKIKASTGLNFNRNTSFLQKPSPTYGLPALNLNTGVHPVPNDITQGMFADTPELNFQDPKDIVNEAVNSYGYQDPYKRVMKQPNFSTERVLPGANDPNSPFFDTSVQMPEFKRTEFGRSPMSGDPAITKEGGEGNPVDWKNAINSIAEVSNMGYNFWKGAQDPDYYKATMNPEYAKAVNLMEGREFNADPLIAAANRTFDQGRAAIEQGASSEAVRAANIQGLQQRADDAKFKALAMKQNQDNTYRADEANVRRLLGTEQANLLNQQELNRLRTDAAKDSFTAQGFADMSKWGQRNKLMAGQQDVDLVLADLLKQGYDYKSIRSAMDKYEKSQTS